MEHVISSDGTRIAYERTGTGPPLVMVHGAAGDHARWGPVKAFLEPHFTVYAMDRRGRGESGDSATGYSFDLEAEDVAAVANSVDGPVNLYGHSGGASFVLEATPKIRHPGRIVLYEGVFPARSGMFPASIADKLQALVEAGEPEEVVVTFLREVPKMPEHEIEHMRTLPNWWRRVATAATLPREVRGANEYCFDPDRFVDMRVPALLLVGSDSPEVFKKSADLVHATLPNSRVQELPGQQHLADVMAPEMIASAVIEFLNEGVASSAAADR